YAILTVGDGLVSQIPAVIISIASALLLARGGATGAADLALIGQLGRYPPALATVAVLMALFALVPGLPFVPFVIGALVLAGAAFTVHRNAQRRAASARTAAETAPPPGKPTSMGDILDLDDIHVEFAPDLVGMVLDPATGLDARIESMRKHVAEVYGLVLPEIRLTDNAALHPGTYIMRIQGVEQARDRLQPDSVLVLLADDAQPLPPGETVKEPVYGAPARWISATERENLALAGLTIVGPTEVLATHLLEVIRSNFARLLTLKSLRRLLDELTNLSDPARAEANRRMLAELVPDKVPVDMLLAVLRLLLDERVSIRNLPLILESIAEIRHSAPNPEIICEYVRHRLGFQLVAEHKRADGTIPLLQLAPEWEERFSTYQIDSDNGARDVALPPEDFNKLANAVADKLAKAGETGIFPAVVTSSRRRRYVRTVLSARGISAPVLSFEEIGTQARPSLVGLVPA
uniref:FHIPEP family type III secretion protein n=1 Tax=Actibacterium sp. TaxID=1872125 RepID=UPI0035656F22